MEWNQDLNSIGVGMELNSEPNCLVNSEMESKSSPYCLMSKDGMESRLFFILKFF